MKQDLLEKNISKKHPGERQREMETDRDRQRQTETDREGSESRQTCLSIK